MLVFQKRRPSLGWHAQVKKEQKAPDSVPKSDNDPGPKAEQMLELEEVYEENKTRFMEEVG